MSDARRFQLDELTIRPGTYFNPQTEVLIVVDDSPEVDHEIFECRGLRRHRLGADRRGRARRRTPPRRADRAFRVTYQPGGELLVAERRRRSSRTRTTTRAATTTSSSSANSRAGATRATRARVLSGMPLPPPGRAATPAAHRVAARRPRVHAPRARKASLDAAPSASWRCVAATARRRGRAARACPARCRASSAAARSRAAAYKHYYAIYAAAKRSLGRAQRHAALRARRGDGATCRRWPPQRLLHRLAPAGRVPDAGKQPPLVDDRTAALQRRARELPRRARSCGSTTPGQGIEIQWLGHLRQGQRLLPLGTRKRQPAPAASPKCCRWRPSAPAGIAWEYMFQLRRRRAAVDERAVAGHRRCRCSRAPYAALQRTGLADRRAAGRSASSRRRPPTGVQVKTPAGAHYAEYTYAPSRPHPQRLHPGGRRPLRLHAITRTRSALKLFEAGDAEARVEMPHYDTGAWSLYDQYSESNLNYHELLTEFLQHLCERTRKGPPMPAPRPRPRRRRPRRHRRPPRRPAARAAPPPAADRRAAAARRGAHGGRDDDPAADADPGRRRLLHDRQELQSRPEDAARDLAADQLAADRHPRGRAASRCRRSRPCA